MGPSSHQSRIPFQFHSFSSPTQSKRPLRSAGTRRPRLFFLMLAVLVIGFAPAPSLQAEGPAWLQLEGSSGPGEGKHIVLISGDEEYRSEEALPMLAELMSTRHGFKCTVLFSIDETGQVNPEFRSSTPGIERLAEADLMVI